MFYFCIEKKFRLRTRNYFLASYILNRKYITPVFYVLFFIHLRITDIFMKDSFIANNQKMNQWLHFLMILFDNVSTAMFGGNEKNRKELTITIQQTLKEPVESNSH